MHTAALAARTTGAPRGERALSKKFRCGSEGVQQAGRTAVPRGVSQGCEGQRRHAPPARGASPSTGAHNTLKNTQDLHSKHWCIARGERRAEQGLTCRETRAAS